MSARSLSLSLHKVPVHSSLLPFLYQTRTIQSPAKWSSRAQRSFHTSHIRQRDAIPFESELRDQQPDLSNRSPSSSSFQHNPLNPFPGDPFPEDDSPQPPRASTITASEQAVFNRIFKEISADASKKAAREEDPLDDDFEAELPTTGDAYDDLDAIFDDALRKFRQDSQHDFDSRVEEARLDGPSKNYVTAITVVKDKLKRLELSKLRLGEGHEAIQAAVADHRRRVLVMLRGARSDMAIWDVLDTEVFTLIRQYDDLKKKAEERENAKKPKRKRGRLSKTDLEAASAAEQKQSLRATQKTSQEAETEAVLSSNYGDCCLAAMRRLRRAYPTSPYCMNLLPTIKRLGPISHVLATSVDLYNEILFLQWREYSDLHGMADLIIEMGNQGLEGNEVSLRILKMVRNARLFAFGEDKPMKRWWNLYPVDEGYKRLKILAREMNHEILQARVRRSVEEMELRNGSDEGSLLDPGRRVKRSLADEATILDGGFGSG